MPAKVGDEKLENQITVKKSFISAETKAAPQTVK